MATGGDPLCFWRLRRRWIHQCNFALSLLCLGNDRSLSPLAWNIYNILREPIYYHSDHFFQKIHISHVHCPALEWIYRFKKSRMNPLLERYFDKIMALKIPTDIPTCSPSPPNMSGKKKAENRSGYESAVYSGTEISHSVIVIADSSLISNFHFVRIVMQHTWRFLI